ncbi:MAG: response regulator transcription factor [Chloroflexota bacterium]
MIRVVIADDQAVVCAGLAAIVNQDPEIEVIGQAYNGEEACSLVSQLAPDLVLMDLHMPILNGVEATRTIKDNFPHIYILVLTTYATDDWLFDALRAGASGYLLKDTLPDQLIASIKGTLQGDTYLDPAVAGAVLRQATQVSIPETTSTGLIDTLTTRERDILALLPNGLNNREIGEQLHLATGTVRNHVSTILEKLGVSDRTQAAVIALQAGLVNK